MKNVVGDILQFLLAALIAIGVSLWAYRHLNGRDSGPQTVVIEQRVDTLVIHDTITAYKPTPVRVYVVDTMFVPVPVPGGRDTVWAELPRERKVYEDTTYRAVISGYLPDLDTIEVFRKTVFVDKVQSVYVEPSPWSIGIQAGYGASKDGLSPYVGIGIQYRLWAPKARRAPP